jgi:hypothetical protein
LASAQYWTVIWFLAPGVSVVVRIVTAARPAALTLAVPMVLPLCRIRTLPPVASARQAVLTVTVAGLPWDTLPLALTEATTARAFSPGRNWRARKYVALKSHDLNSSIPVKTRPVGSLEILGWSKVLATAFLGCFQGTAAAWPSDRSSSVWPRPMAPRVYFTPLGGSEMVGLAVS